MVSFYPFREENTALSLLDNLITRRTTTWWLKAEPSNHLSELVQEAKQQRALLLKRSEIEKS